MNESVTPVTDAYAPREIAERVERMGVAKARSDGFTLFVLAVLAGAFIALGALFFTVVVTGGSFGFGVNRLLGGLAFSLGLILVVVGGAELFTGNNLLAMAWASSLVRTHEVFRNWAVVYAGNLVGSLGTVLLVYLARLDALHDGAVGATAVRIAAGKAALPLVEAFARGVLCNALVCLAVWLAMGGRNVTDKVVAIVFPITAFVTVGAEHCVANMYFLPYGMALAEPTRIGLDAALANLLAVTAGNIVGGTILVAAVYWAAYLRGRPAPDLETR